MNQSRKLKLFLSNSQVKPKVVSQAPSIQANIKGHRQEDANSVYFIDFNTDNLHHWEKKSYTSLLLQHPSQQSRHSNMAGKVCSPSYNAGEVLRNNWKESKCFSSRPGTGKGWQLLLCWVHIFVFLWSTWKLQGRTSGLRRAAGSAAGCAGTPHHAQPRPLSRAPKLPRGTGFSAEQGAGGAPWPSSLPSQPSSCMAVIRHPEHTLLRSLSASSFLLQPGYGLISNTNNFLKKEMAPIGTKSPLVSPSAVALLLSAISPFSSLSFTATVL